jgi:Mn2+/Fe2+ NRAMP family transporter
VDYHYREAPAFFGLYTGIIMLSAALILIPGISLMGIIIATQQIAGVLSPAILTFMIVLINDQRIMGSYVNTKVQNLISWVTVIFIVVLSVILMVSPVFF